MVTVCNWQSKELIPQASEATLGYNLLFNDTADPAVADVWGPQGRFRVTPWVAGGLCVALKEPSLESGAPGLRPGPTGGGWGGGRFASGSSYRFLGLFLMIASSHPLSLTGVLAQRPSSGTFRMPPACRGLWVALASSPLATTTLLIKQANHCLCLPQTVSICIKECT